MQVNRIDKEGCKVAVGDLCYGTLVTGEPNYPQSHYVKVDKHTVGSGLKLTFSRDHSVLFNIKTGSLREIHGSVKVIVLDNKLDAWEAEDTRDFRKRGC